MSRSEASARPPLAPSRGGSVRERLARITLSDLPCLAAIGAVAILAGCGSTPRTGGGSVPSAARANLAVAEQAIAEGRDADARALLEPLTSAANPAGVRGEAFLGLGRIELRAGEIEPALLRFDDARALLRRHPLWATAELLYGESRIRAGHLQSGVDALENAFGYLVSPADRTRAAYLIVRTHEISGSAAPTRYAELARGAHYPEYDAVFEHYAVKPAPRSPRAETPRRTAPPTVAAAAATKPKFVSRREWGAAPIRSNIVPNQRWTRITIHHTADQGEMVALGNGDTAGYLRRLQDYFQDVKKYADLPYHFLIAEDGRVFEGRTLQYQGAHAGGSANQENIGIALIGNFERKSPTESQTQALRSLVSRLSGEYGIARSRIHPHCDLKETRCPGAQLEHTVRALYGSLPATGDAVLCGHDHAREKGPHEASAEIGD